MSILALFLLAACSVGDDASDNRETPTAAVPVTMPASEPANRANLPSTRQATKDSEEQSLETFWTKFRRAALENDAAGIAALSAPVVIQNGDLDDSPKYRLKPAQVTPVLAKILGNRDGLDPQERTQRQLMEAASAPPNDRSATQGNYRFGDMGFTRGSNGWRLTALYYESYD